MSLTSIDLGLDELICDRDRRNAFFRSITQDEIATQIRALRKLRQLTQNAFAELAGMKQSAVSRIEQADYAAWSLTTLFRAGEALDARWRMILEPVEDAMREYLPKTEDTEYDQVNGDAARAAARASQQPNAPPGSTILRNDVPRSEAVQWLPSGSASAESHSARIGPTIHPRFDAGAAQ